MNPEKQRKKLLKQQIKAQQVTTREEALECLRKAEKARAKLEGEID